MADTAIPDTQVIPELTSVSSDLRRAALGACQDTSVFLTSPPSTYGRHVKPAMDALGSVVLLTALIPLVLAVAVLIRATMGRGVFFRQRRVGLNGKSFTMIKFRTMAPDRRIAQRPLKGSDRRVSHKREDDPRHTRVGRLLRKLSIDEIPQLWNVVRGEMSLVGPRPELSNIVDTYEPWQHHRHVVKPGVTGLWQVTARGDGPMQQYTHIDLEYIATVSLATDIKILALTVPSVFGRRTGA